MYQDLVESIHDDILAKCENRVLELARQYDHELDLDVTDDEVSG
jgi:hypothetical protein